MATEPELRQRNDIPVNCDERFWDHSEDGANDVGSIFDVGSGDDEIEERVRNWGESQERNGAHMLRPTALLGDSQNGCLLWILGQPHLQKENHK